MAGKKNNRGNLGKNIDCPIPSKEAILLGNKIQLALKFKGWRQGDLAEKMGVNNMTVSRWISGTYPPNALQIKRIAELTEQELEFFYM